jgi:hypothetical protein
MDHHEDAIPYATGGIIDTSKVKGLVMPGPCHPGHLDPLAQLQAAYCRACRDRADVLPISWPELAEICVGKTESLRVVNIDGKMREHKVPICVWLGVGPNRCARIQCPQWADLKLKRKER